MGEYVTSLLLEPLCIRTKNQYLEIDNYNKGIEEPTGNVMNRLELRSKKLYSNVNSDMKDLQEFYKWTKRLKKAVSDTNIALLERVHIKTASKIIASMITERKTTSSLS